jgi:uncharacterized Zn finger protein
MGWYSFRPYVSVAQRKAKAARHMAKLAKSGQACCPIKIDGRKICTTFWGSAWCDHLESYSDFSNRLPRGRSYVRNGSVVDLQIKPGTVTAVVCGSDLYEIEVKIKPLAPARWSALKSSCGGQIASLIELLQGRFSKGVMEIITHRERGMFPAPAEISLDCSCPDYAGMCKHIAAVLYGVGARFDHEPELLFTLRQVDHLELIERAGNAGSIAVAASSSRKTIAAGELSDVFGIEMAAPASDPPLAPMPAKRASVHRAKNAVAEARDAAAPRHGRITESSRAESDASAPAKQSRRTKAARQSK